MSEKKVPLLAVLLALGAGFLGTTFLTSRDGRGPLNTPAWLLPFFLLVLFLIFMFYFFERIEVGSGLPIPQRVTAILVVLAAAFGAVYTLGAQNSPLLGLDLQGGVSVVLEPVATTDKPITDESLDLTVELLRSRIDEIGVAEPEISRQSNNIVVGLPGVVEDQQEALRRLKQTAELRFRPVFLDTQIMAQLDFQAQLDQLEAEGIDLDSLVDDEGNIVEGTPVDDPQDADNTETGGSDTDADTSDADSADSDAVDIDATNTDAPDADTTKTDTGESTDSSTTPGSLPFQDDGVTETSAAESTETTIDGSSTSVAESSTTVAEATDDTIPLETIPGEGLIPSDDLVVAPEQGLDEASASPEQLAALDACGLGAAGSDGAGLVDGLTPDDADVSDAYVVLADSDGLRYCLGPTLLTGETIEDASATLIPGQQGWVVNPTYLPGEAGIDQFNRAAALCNAGDPDVCPEGTNGERGRLAVVLDHEVISAPSINAANFRRSDIVISGAFDEAGARRLAEALRFGSLPLELKAQETRTVSASIGQDVLRSGVIAGIIGLALVALYLLAYYRLAGLVAISGLLLSAMLLWTIVAWFGEKFGLALSLAGVVGLIVSIGVSTDSNIVYFENVKDSYRSGRRVPTAVERAYESAISTIVKADVVSLIAAGLLYFLTVGAVRGFAFYLGLATILDLIISWMFMRPALGWLARRAQVENNPKMLGLPAEGGAQ